MTTAKKIALPIRWIARIASVASILVIGMFLFGGQESNEFLNANEVVGFLLFPVGIVNGMLLGWKWEIPGGILAVISLVAFYAWHQMSSGDFPTGPWFLIFASPAFGFLLSGLIDSRSRAAKDEQLAG